MHSPLRPLFRMTSARRTSLCLLGVWLVCLSPAAGVAQPDSLASPTGSTPHHLADRPPPTAARLAPGAPSVAAPGECGAPSRASMYVRTAYVPDTLGAELVFGDVGFDLLLTDGALDGKSRARFLRTTIQGVRSTVASEDRTASVLGNLRLELWFTDVRPTVQPTTRFSWAIGASVPTDFVTGTPGRIYEMRPEITVPGVAAWLALNWTRRGYRWDVMADVLLGYDYSTKGDSGLVASASLTLAYRVHESVSLPIAFVAPGWFLAHTPVLSTGVRWRPIPQIELGVGSYIRLGSLFGAEVTRAPSPSPWRPSCDLKVSF